MPVSEADRDYMRRLGVCEAEGHVQRTADHLAADLAERLRRSVAMSRRFWRSANLAGRVDDPSPFYARARELGFYRP